jgi:hypothetical protein
MIFNIYSLDTPLSDAIAHFERKHGVTPDVVRVNPGNAPDTKTVAGLEVVKLYCIGTKTFELVVDKE